MTSSRASKRHLILYCHTLLLLATLSCDGCRKQVLEESHDAPSQDIPSQDIKKIVDEISLIESVAPKARLASDDEHALRILSLDKKAGPFLVEKLTDTTETQAFQLFQYKVGDLALNLLTIIYDPKDWPFPDGSMKIPIRNGDFRDYLDFVETPGMRLKLQQSWREYVSLH